MASLSVELAGRVDPPCSTQRWLHLTHDHRATLGLPVLAGTKIINQLFSHAPFIQFITGLPSGDMAHSREILGVHYPSDSEASRIFARQFVNKLFQTFVSLDRFSCLSGDDIRYNDAPILTNKMASTSVNWFGKVNIKNFSIIASAGRVLNGRNVGEATSFGIGGAYLFKVFNKEKAVLKQ